MYHFAIRFILGWSLVFSLSLSLWGQEQAVALPASWHGNWGGELVISNGGGELQRLPMSLDIHPLTDSTFTYTIVYGEKTPENTRPYILRIVDAERGHYQVDEQNSILLDNYLIGNKLYSRFSVMGGLLLATIEQQGDRLIYEIISGPLEAQTITGGTTVKEEEIPPVSSYGIQVQQRAILQRLPNKSN